MSLVSGCLSGTCRLWVQDLLLLKDCLLPCPANPVLSPGLNPARTLLLGRGRTLSHDPGQGQRDHTIKCDHPSRSLPQCMAPLLPLKTIVQLIIPYSMQCDMSRVLAGTFREKLLRQHCCPAVAVAGTPLPSHPPSRPTPTTHTQSPVTHGQETHDTGSDLHQR